MIGTLIWVGPTTPAEFRGAVRYCLVHVAQLAFRRDVAEAVARPASDVRWILFVQSNRGGGNREPLLDRYPDAKVLTLRGPLCQGIRDTCHDILDRHTATVCDWQGWDQVLPAWLGITTTQVKCCRTVAVVAATLAMAEPLMDLAAACGAMAVWCRDPVGNQVRNVDAVWWDDSVAHPTSTPQWQARIHQFREGVRPIQHAWISSAPTISQAQQARAAGVDWLVCKPHRIDALAAMLNQNALSRRPAVAGPSGIAGRAA
jgi:hypothetical protein